MVEMDRQCTKFERGINYQPRIQTEESAAEKLLR
jgi:hypothetical protein